MQPEQVAWVGHPRRVPSLLRKGRWGYFSLNAVLLGSFFLFLMIKRMIAAGRPIWGEDILELPYQVGVPKFFWALLPKAAKRANEGPLSIHKLGWAISRWEKWAVSLRGWPPTLPVSVSL